MLRQGERILSSLSSSVEGLRRPRKDRWSRHTLSTLDGSVSGCRDCQCVAFDGGAPASGLKEMGRATSSSSIDQGLYPLIRSLISTNPTCGSIDLHLIVALSGHELQPLYGPRPGPSCTKGWFVVA